MARENNITRIYEALLNRLGKVCSKEEIVSVIKEYNKKFKTKIETDSGVKYLSRHRYIKRIFLSFYYINSVDERKRGYCKFEDRELLFLVLNKLNLKWYLGLSSALYESGKTWQIPTVISIVNNKLSGKRKVLKVNIRFIKIKEKLIFAVKSAKTKNNIGYSYSIPSKTYLDMIYFRVTDKPVKDKDAKKYIKKFPKWVGKKLT
ncbi:MAG: hypothetical protein ABH840_00945 [Nanoarchaeota archaeon]